MSVERSLLTEFVSDIWRLVVGRAVETAAEIPPPATGWTFACVQITGAWRGTVTVAADAELVRALAAAMLSVPAERVSDTDRADALGDLTGMVAGNLKAVLPPPCYLSGPVRPGSGAARCRSARHRLRRGR